MDSSKCISFVRSVLNPNTPFPEIRSEEEWMDLYGFSKKQAIVGIVFDGIKRYQETGCGSVPLDVVMNWYGKTIQIKERNRLLNKRCAEVSSFFAEAGFRSCILKGQGNAMMYPHPTMRFPGDIDIWVEGDRKAIKEVIRNKVGKTFEVSHHIAFPLFDDVSTEVHFTPTEMCNPFYNRRLQHYFSLHRTAQMANLISLGNEDERISVPEKLFNAVFQLSHIMFHFFIEGIGLRQFIDYFYLLSSGFTAEEKDDYMRLVKELGMKKFAESVMWIEQEVLGLDEQFLLIDPYESGGKLILEEILETGNMGFYDTRSDLRRRGLLGRGIADTIRDLQLARVFPSEGLSKPLQKIVNLKWKIKESYRKTSVCHHDGLR